MSNNALQFEIAQGTAMLFRAHRERDALLIASARRHLQFLDDLGLVWKWAKEQEKPCQN